MPLFLLLVPWSSFFSFFLLLRNDIYKMGPDISIFLYMYKRGWINYDYVNLLKYKIFNIKKI